MRIRHLLPLFGISLLSVMQNASADCNCKKFPFRPNPPCEDQCYARLLKESSPSSLSAVLGIPSELSTKIERINASSSSDRTWEGYKKKLTAQEVTKLKDAFLGLADAKVASLEKTGLHGGSREMRSRKDLDGSSEWAGRDARESGPKSRSDQVAVDKADASDPPEEPRSPTEQ